MPLAHPGRADAHPLAAGLVEETARTLFAGVLEGAPCRTVGDRLRPVLPAEQLGHPLSDHALGGALQLKDRFEHNGVAESAIAITRWMMSAFDLDRAFTGTPQADRLNAIPNRSLHTVEIPPSGIHSQRAADMARHTDKPLDAAQIQIDRSPDQGRKADTGPGVNPSRRGHLDLDPVLDLRRLTGTEDPSHLAGMDDRAGNSPIRDEEVRSGAEHPPRRAFRVKTIEESSQFRRCLGFVEPLSRPSDPESGPRSETDVATPFPDRRGYRATSHGREWA